MLGQLKISDLYYLLCVLSGSVFNTQFYYLLCRKKPRYSKNGGRYWESHKTKQQLVLDLITSCDSGGRVFIFDYRM